MNQNRYNIKQRTFAQRHTLLINVVLSVLGLGILFSRPIYDSFSNSSEEIEQLRKEVIRDRKLKQEKIEQQKKEAEAAKKQAEAARKEAEAAKKEAESAKKQ